MDLSAVLLTGFLAGVVSCAAVQGDLLAGPVIRQRRTLHSAPPPAVVRLADNLAPVAGFLTGKLLSHTALGALLGALGVTMQPSEVSA